ncbi:hypothetical protein TBLA_0B03710 [Henningerozyma blattae CBS 6284]|uniref:Uncharacterized protein n=1 Tax=Henningerozyma blattae (strain ATCC 34711 / CBS 6284 / DSM 70876 / NBRC 10599 / NRRL Y-10934 / UCD 77-7) TaxID=1071380 RepID=I2GYK8_HENB6|nr:hypothetical protein TBLA_0B03710 [Tetrapisispora blattae CBS 6284]CCH59210.1 hypothetical protein TBLA_0B03710 [Tetrapisispora blattae CBS 6284]
MKAAPIPRKSKSRWVTMKLVKIGNVLHCYPCRKRWSLHKLHCKNRTLTFKSIKNKRKNTNKTAITTTINDLYSPTISLRGEDMLDIETSLRPASRNRKPLLITTFPDGCSASPRIHILQKTRFGRYVVSKRRYKLKYFNSESFTERIVKVKPKPKKQENLIHIEDNQNHNQNEENPTVLTIEPLVQVPKNDQNPSYTCAQTIHLIKNEISKNSDFRVIFHDKNVIKTLNLPSNIENIEFGGPSQSIRLSDFGSLRNPTLPIMTDPVLENPVIDDDPIIDEDSAIDDTVLENSATNKPPLSNEGLLLVEDGEYPQVEIQNKECEKEVRDVNEVKETKEIKKKMIPPPKIIINLHDYFKRKGKKPFFEIRKREFMSKNIVSHSQMVEKLR